MLKRGAEEREEGMSTAPGEFLEMICLHPWFLRASGMVLLDAASSGAITTKSMKLNDGI